MLYKILVITIVKWNINMIYLHFGWLSVNIFDKHIETDLMQTN